MDEKIVAVLNESFYFTDEKAAGSDFKNIF